MSDVVEPYGIKHQNLHDIGVMWREYDFGGRTYRIQDPIHLWYREGGSTHRILDPQGVLHLVPAPGFNGCVMRQKKAPGFPPVSF
jgi:hypothetical protein